MKIIRLLFVMAITLLAQEDEGLKVFGKFRTYHIHTIKDGSSTADAWANSVGGELAVQTQSIENMYGFVNMMTTNGVFLPESVDGSILSNDLALYDGGTNSRSFSVLGEAYFGYAYDTFLVKAGYQKVKTPLASDKDVRMLPSTFRGITAEYSVDHFTMSAAYIDQFKQRTSNQFINILEHAFGSKTSALTGVSQGGMWMASLEYAQDAVSAKLYEYYHTDFINSLYAEAVVTVNDLVLKGQLVTQNSVGGLDKSLRSGVVYGSGVYSEGIHALAAGAEADLKMGATTLSTSVTGTMKYDNALSDVIAVYDGTPLFTDTITGNNLFKSKYGEAVKRADAEYKAGTLGYQLKVAHSLFDRLKIMGSLTQYRQNFSVAQTDINAVIAYKIEGWSLAAKGIWVLDNNQNVGDTLHQYRLIATRYF